MRTLSYPRLAVLWLALVVGASAAAQRATAQPASAEPASAQPAPAQPAGGSAPARELLNSERIEATFGSYAIEVLEASPDLRVSSLQSLEASGAVCRTFAVVRYPDAIAPDVAAEHAAIVSGGSIGAVFTANGWTVTKTHLHYGPMPAGPRAAQLMVIPPGTAVAAHVYLLEVVKDGRKFPYAAIAELHHPDYLTVDALPRIYGPAAASGNEALLTAMLETAAREASGPQAP